MWRSVSLSACVCGMALAPLSFDLCSHVPPRARPQYAARGGGGDRKVSYCINKCVALRHTKTRTTITNISCSATRSFAQSSGGGARA